MKTLILYIDGVKCQFAGGDLTIKTPLRFNQNWLRRNRDEISHYKELTRRREEKRHIDNSFDLETDCLGNCFSDADPGL